MQDILLIESNIRDAHVALQSFKAKGLVNDVRVAGDGPEALDFLLSRNALERRGEAQPVLILLNLSLPLIGGLEVLRIIKSDPRAKRIPVVVLTSSVSDLDIQCAIRFRADAFIEKPLTFQKLLVTAGQLGVPLSHQSVGLSAGDRLAR
ncbi:MAG TPA: response regulator [Candidatus Acidoferrales bacterium]|nr:response regulator [Candidatus Acidoferrales bacterium]